MKWDARHDETAREMRTRYTGEGLPPAVLQELQNAAETRNVRVRDILSRSRYGPVVAARKDVAANLIRAGNSHAQIGRWLFLNHSTIAHYAKCRETQTHRAMSLGQRVRILENTVRELCARLEAPLPPSLDKNYGLSDGARIV